MLSDPTMGYMSCYTYIVRVCLPLKLLEMAQNNDQWTGTDNSNHLLCVFHLHLSVHNQSYSLSRK